MGTITSRTAASYDDGYCSAENLYRTSDFIVLGKGSSAYRAWMRHPDITIANGEHIVSAVLTFRAYATSSTTTCTVRIYGADMDDAVTPATPAAYDALVKTTAYVDWSPGSVTADANFDSPDITDIVQEIIDRPGWVSGNSIMLLVEDNGGTAYRQAETYDEGSAYGPLITIVYGEIPVTDTITFSDGLLVAKSPMNVAETITMSELVWGGYRPEAEDTLSLSEDVYTNRVLAPVEESIGIVEEILVYKVLHQVEESRLFDATTIQRGDWTLARTHPQTAKLYLAVKTPRVIWRATVAHDRGYDSATPDADQAIHFTSGANETGFDIDDFLPDITLWIGDAEGLKNHGRCRLKSVSGSELSVSADMSCVWHEGDYITALDLHEYWPRMHTTSYDGTTVTFLKDGDIPVASRREEPVPIMGPPACGFLDSVTGEVTIAFDGSESYVVPPCNPIVVSGTRNYWTTKYGVSSYAWWFEGADVETATTPYATATYSTAGQYVVRLTVTGENGYSSIGFRNVFIFERTGANAPIDHFSFGQLTGSVSNHGWEGEIEVFGDYFTSANLPNDAQVVLFSEETFAGSSPTVRVGRAADLPRHNIKLVAWVATTSLKYSSGRIRSASLTLKGLQLLLSSAGNFPCYWSQVEVYAPAWSKMTVPNGLTVSKCWYHTLRWHWTIFNFTDVYIPLDHQNYLPAQSFGEGTLSSWLDEFTKDTQSEWVTDRGGSLHIYSVPNYLPVPGYLDSAGLEDLYPDDIKWREDLYSSVHLTEDDIEEVVAEARIRQDIARVRVGGVMASHTGWYAACSDMAPGDIKGLKGVTNTLSNQVLGTGGFRGSQGYELALMKYAEETRNIERASLVFAGNYSFLDIAPYANWITVTAQPTGGLRELNWTQKPFWIYSVTLTYENGVLSMTADALPETYPDFDLNVYSQFDEVGEVRQIVGTTGSVILPGLLKEIATPEETIIPALMGDGAGHVEGHDPTNVTARLYGSLDYLMQIENRVLQAVDDRPIYVQQIKDAVGGKRYRVVGAREADDTDADSDEKRARTVRTAIYVQPGYVTESLNQGTVSVPSYAKTKFFGVGPNTQEVVLRYLTVSAFIEAGGSLTLSIYHRSALGTTLLTSVGLTGGETDADVEYKDVLTGTMVTTDGLYVTITESESAYDLYIGAECVVHGV